MFGCGKQFLGDEINYYHIYLFINYNTITNYILIIYELSNLDHVLSVVSQTRLSGKNRIHIPPANSPAHYPLGYQGTLLSYQRTS